MRGRRTRWTQGCGYFKHLQHAECLEHRFGDLRDIAPPVEFDEFTLATIILDQWQCLHKVHFQAAAGGLERIVVTLVEPVAACVADAWSPSREIVAIVD